MAKIVFFQSLNTLIWGATNHGLARWQLFLKAICRTFFIFWREFQQDNIPLRSCALTFTIVLSLVPVLALGTAVLKGLGAGDQMKQAAYRFIDSIETSSPSPTESEDATSSDNNTAIKPIFLPSVATAPLPADSTAEPATANGSDPLSNHLRKAADQIFSYVDKTDFATLGAFGIIGLIFSVLSVLGSIEQSMNVIWKAPRGRPFSQKLMDYMALMILLPLSVNLALATETTLQNKTLFRMFNDLLPIAWLTSFLLNILPFILVIGTFTVLYRFLPNTKVRLLPALIGGTVGGSCWLFAQTLYLTLQIGVAKYNAIYGSFATLPLFLLWLYLGWLIFLAGAELAFACQTWPMYNREHKEMSPICKLSLAFSILELVFKSFKNGKTRSLAEISEYLQWQANEVQIIVDLLTDGGMLHHVSEKNLEGYVPARPEETLDIRETLSLVLGPLTGPKHNLATQAYEGARSSLTGKTL